MSKHGKKHYSHSIGGPFVPILFDEIDSAAFSQLNNTALKTLILFKRVNGIRRKKAGEGFNGIFEFTYTEAQRYGLAKKTFSRAIGELVDKGFVDVIETGGLRGNARSNSKYKLAERWRDYGKHVFIKRPRYPSEPKF